MSHLAQNTNTDTAPAISPKWRTGIYVACLVANVLAIVIFGLGVVFEIISIEKAAASFGIIFAAIGIVSSSLSIGYRPTKLDSTK